MCLCIPDCCVGVYEDVGCCAGLGPCGERTTNTYSIVLPLTNFATVFLDCLALLSKAKIHSPEYQKIHIVGDISLELHLRSVVLGAIVYRVLAHPSDSLLSAVYRLAYHFSITLIST